MNEILGNAQTVRELLKGRKYSIDYYQRDFKWEKKQIVDLINDLSNKFLISYKPGDSSEKVDSYGHYFLGSIIISKKGTDKFLVDGQQRLTSLTLLLIYLNNIRKASAIYITDVDELIFSERLRKKSFNLNVEDQIPCMEGLYEKGQFNTDSQIDSVKNIVKRYNDIIDAFPAELKEDALPNFVDWLIENVHLVEITAYSDEDAYMIFETMNDRGLSLSSIEMLKGYLLSNINDPEKRNSLNNFWKERILELNKYDSNIPFEFFKNWIRSQYATKIRERKVNADPEDFDLIGTEFHRWIRENHVSLGLNQSSDYVQFIERDFDFYSKQYQRIILASIAPFNDQEFILYNAQQGFTLQNLVILSPLKPTDDDEDIFLKMRLVSMYLDILLTWRLWNLRSIAYSTMQYAMFILMRDIRGLDSEDLAKKLYTKLAEETENFDTAGRFYLHQQNRRYVQRILSRMTDYIEQESGLPSRYWEYISGEGTEKYTIEHIWADKPEEHIDEFTHPVDFEDYRNRIGGLLITTQPFNSSYGDLPYTEKLPYYDHENLLARSLNLLSYEHNPGFLRFIRP